METICPFCQSRVTSTEPDHRCPACSQQVHRDRQPASHPQKPRSTDSPKGQRPDYYRLLGLIEFESNPQTIEEAISRKSAGLRALCNGPQHIEASRRLRMLEVVRNCLLDAEQKATYDRWLLERMVQKASPKSSLADRARPKPSFSARRKRSRSQLPKLPAGVASTVLAGMLATFIGYVLFFHYIPNLVRENVRRAISEQQRRVKPPQRARKEATTPRVPQEPPQIKAQLPLEPPVDVTPGTAPKTFNVNTLERPRDEQTRAVTREPAPPRDATATVVLDLSRSDMFTRLPRTGTSTEVTIVGLTKLPTQYKLQPTDGVVRPGQRVVASLVGESGEGLGILVEFSLVSRRSAPRLKISPMLALTDEKRLDFSIDRVGRRRIAVAKVASRGSIVLREMEARRDHMKSWLKSRVVKDLDAKKRRLLEITALERQIKRGSEVMARHVAELETLRRLAHLAQQIHNHTEVKLAIHSNLELH